MEMRITAIHPGMTPMIRMRTRMKRMKIRRMRRRRRKEPLSYTADPLCSTYSIPTPPPSLPISLSPPSAGERLVRCTTPLALSSLPPVPSPLLSSYGCPTQIQTLKIASTQTLIDAVTTALPSPPLPPSLYIPPPVDRRDDISESEQPPRKRLCLSTLGSRYEVGESSTASPIGGTRDSIMGLSERDAERETRHGISEVGYGIRGLLGWIRQRQFLGSTSDRGERRQYGLWRRRPMLPERLGLTDRIAYCLQGYSYSDTSSRYMRLASQIAAGLRWRKLIERMTVKRKGQDGRDSSP
ncbi:hypothetical protein Tco_0277664 [Tanacetum coccineum]